MRKTRTLLGSLAIGALLGSLSVAALAQSDEPVPIPIEGAEGIEWRLAEQVVDGTLTAVPDGVTVTLLLQDGQATGSGGCNRYFASYTIDTSALTLGDIGSTLMFCEGAPGEVEAAYLANLANVATWANTGGSLVLGDPSGQPMMTYLPSSAPSRDSVEGLDWQLTAQLINGELAPVDPAVTVTLRLDEGRAGGNGGCNSYFADYTLNGRSLAFESIGATQMFCEGAGSEVEAAYFANLANVASWAVDGDSLSLADASGVVVLQYLHVEGTSIIGSWVATGINNGAEAVVTTDITPQVTAEFHPDGVLSGSDGCNAYTTSYQLDGAQIAISDAIASTRMACLSDALSEQSQQYVAALLASATWSIDASGALQLRDDADALQVSFAAAS